jgi:hypothetical protein
LFMMFLFTAFYAGITAALWWSLWGRPLPSAATDVAGNGPADEERGTPKR